MKVLKLLSVLALCVVFITGAAFAQGAIKITVNGKEIASDVPPVIQNGRVLVPLRFVAEALQADVDWDPVTRTARISQNIVGTEKELYHAALLGTVATQSVLSVYETGATPTDEQKWRLLRSIFWLEQAQRQLLNKSFPADLYPYQIDTLEWLESFKVACWLRWDTWRTGQTSLSELLKGFTAYDHTYFKNRISVKWYDENQKRLLAAYGKPDQNAFGTQQDFNNWLQRNASRIGQLPAVK
ncbi:MAG: copper amine oxidase N-terminal domain-containing protein [Bacillota bacterium]